MRKLVLLAGVCGVLAACSQETKEDLGLVNVAPDEFAVVTRAPLSVPPDYALRPPRPGAARPMEISTTDDARQTVFGVKDVNAKGIAATETPSSGFLNKVGAGKADPNIRAVVDAEDPTDNRTTAEKLLFMKGSDDLGNPIDASEEYNRLKQEGVVATKKRTEDPEAP